MCKIQLLSPILIYAVSFAGTKPRYLHFVNVFVEPLVTLVLSLFQIQRVTNKHIPPVTTIWHITFLIRDDTIPLRFAESQREM